MQLELKTIEDKVAKLLERFPALRSSDKLLITSYFAEYHDIRTFRQFAFSKVELPSFESIRRTRQRIQQKGMFKANEHTQKMRDDLILQYRDYAIGGQDNDD